MMPGGGGVPPLPNKPNKPNNLLSGSADPVATAGGDYYGVPPIHKPHWKWLIIFYFFLGGIAGGSSAIAAISDLFGPRSDRCIVRAGRYLSALATIPCPILLVLDLGRPTRFLHMLRVVKLRSPMSLGTWGLLVFGGLSSLSALIQLAEDGFLGSSGGRILKLPARAIGTLGSLFGVFVAGYTGVLLGATAVPLWARNARLLGPLFLSSAITASIGGVGLVLALVSSPARGTLERLGRAEMVSTFGELALLGATHANAGPLGAPLTRGRLGVIHAVGSVGLGIVLPLVLHIFGSRLRIPLHASTILTSSLTLLGSLAVKYVIVMAGHASADDPRATFRFARRPA